MAAYGRPFSREDLDNDELTLEDVPPKSVGGRPLALTCRACNNKAGAEIDHHAGKAVRADEFSQRGDKREQRLKVNGLQARMRSTDGHMQLWIVPEANHPDAVSAQAEQWAREGVTNTNTRFELPEYTPDRANLSLLRAAYLVVFARWGYRAIVGEAAEALRDQFQNPDDMRLSALCRNDPAQDPSARRLATIIEPEPWRGFVVTFGLRSFLLPPPLAGPDFFVDLEDRTETSEYRAKLVDWPSYPMHELDLLTTDSPPD